MIEIRPFQQRDLGVLLDLANQAVPFASKENAEWLEARMAFDETQRILRHYLATQDGIPVGYGCLEQQSDDPEWLRVFVVCSPANLAGEVATVFTPNYYKMPGRQARPTCGRASSWMMSRFENFFTEQGFVEVRRFTLPDQLPMVVYTLDVAM